MHLFGINNNSLTLFSENNQPNKKKHPFIMPLYQQDTSLRYEC